MLRSKHLKNILEQALTSDIRVCALFNEEGVVLAHAAAAQFLESAANQDSACRRPSPLAALNDRGRQRSPFAGHGGEDAQQGEGERAAGCGSGATGAANSGGRQGLGAERLQRKHTGASVATGGSPRQPQPSVPSLATGGAFGGSGAAQLQEDSQPTEVASCSSSLSDGLAEMSPVTSSREKLEDDLAIAANLWQSYEGVSNLVERKDRDIDDNAGDTASEAQDVIPNLLNTIIIECENGKAVVTRL
ncbi:hypothetical protein GGH95_006281, partial [Coemansia sp. RSA 1836]